jgi:hypothetical protein
VSRVIKEKAAASGPGAFTGWLVSRVLGLVAGRVRGARRSGPRLALLERIALAPRQTLALVEAEGRRFLVATSADGSPAFYALDERARPGPGIGRAAARVSW